MIISPNNLPTVGVLLSTYNGQKYLDDLLKSVLAQSYPNISIFVRDDGSTDNTRTILKKYSNSAAIQIVYGNNIGVVRSYFQLLQEVCPKVDYIAFCDQDDIWRPHKIERAVAMMHQSHPGSIPCLYFSDYCLVDADLTIMGRSCLSSAKPHFKNAIVQNIVTGCTMVINRSAAQQIIRVLPVESNIIMHDWWLYLYASAFGKILFDSEPMVFYRQHGTNLVGAVNNRLLYWLARIRRYFTENAFPKLIRQAKEFNRCFGDVLPSEKKTVLDDFISARGSLKRRIEYAFSGDTFRQSRIDNKIYQFLLLFQKGQGV